METTMENQGLLDVGPSEAGAKADPSRTRPNICGAMMNLVNYTIGVGVLGLPYAMAQGGLAAGILMLLACALGGVLSFLLLLKTSIHTGCKSFEDLARMAGGNKAQVAMGILIILDCLGALASYLQIVADIFHDLLAAEFPHAPSWLLDGRTLNVVTLVFLLPLMVERRLDAFMRLSILSLLPIVFLVLVQTILYLRDGRQSSDPPIWLDAKHALLGLPMLVFAFTSQLAFFHLGHELQGTEQDMKRVIYGSFTITTTAYLLVGTLGYLQFTSSAMDNILNQYDATQPTIQLLMLSNDVAILLGFPLIVWTCRFSVDRLLFPSHPQDDQRFAMENMGIVLTSYAISVVLPSFSKIVGIFSMCATTLTAYILPGMFYIRLVGRRPSCFTWIAAWMLLVVGGIAGILSFVLVCLDAI